MASGAQGIALRGLRPPQLQGVGQKGGELFGVRGEGQGTPGPLQKGTVGPLFGYKIYKDCNVKKREWKIRSKLKI